MTNRFSAYWVYLIYASIVAFASEMVFTVNEIYRIEVAGFNAMQLVLLGTAVELSGFVFEVPTGILADLKSRKLSVIVGVMMLGVGFLVEGLVTSFLVILICQVIWGIGATFISGANEAWIADELGGQGLERVFLKGAQVGQIGSLLATIFATLVGTLMINLPLIMGGVLLLGLGCFLIWYMPETAFHPTPAEDRNSFQQMFHTFTLGLKSIKKSYVLMAMVGITLFYGLYSEGLDRLWIAHILQNVKLPAISVKPIVWVGLINGLAMITSIVAVEYIKRQLEKTGKLQKVWLLIVINAMMMLSIIAFGLAGNFGLAFSTYLTYYIVRITNRPIYRAWVTENIESKVRATVLSTYGQIDALGQIMSGPLIGFIALKAGMGMSIVASGLLLSPVVVLYVYLYRRAKGGEVVS